MKGSGGTEGGVETFLIGLGLAGLGIYLFFDSVHMSTAGMGLVSGMMGRGRGGHGGGMGMWETTSMGIVFVPFAIGVFCLFVNARRTWAWVLTHIGLAIIAIEILSRIRFLINTKLTHFLGMLILFLFGCALMFKSYKRTPKGVLVGTDDPEPIHPPESGEGDSK